VITGEAFIGVARDWSWEGQTEAQMPKLETEDRERGYGSLGGFTEPSARQLGGPAVPPTIMQWWANQVTI